MENLPEKLTDMILDKSFEHLSDDEKVFLSKYIDKQEYNEMKSAYQLLEAASIPSSSANDVLRGKAFTIFEDHQPKTIALWQQAIPVWQAACAACFVFILWLVHWQTYMDLSPVNRSRIDTVYIEKEVPVKVYDTVYIHQTGVENQYQIEKRYSTTHTNAYSKNEMIVLAQKRHEEGVRFYVSKFVYNA